MDKKIKAVKAWSKRHKVWAGVIVGYLALSVIIAVGGGIASIATKEPVKSTGTQQTEQQPAKAVDNPAPAAAAPKYSIVHELDGHRYDDGKTYYALMDTVDLSTDFKAGVKAIVKELVAKHGGKITVELHDSQASLDVSYKQYGDMSLGRPRTATEEAEQERHYIATFSGQLDTNLYTNELDFFPAATKHSSVVGSYVEAGEFNP